MANAMQELEEVPGTKWGAVRMTLLQSTHFTKLFLHLTEKQWLTSRATSFHDVLNVCRNSKAASDDLVNALTRHLGPDHSITTMAEEDVQILGKTNGDGFGFHDVKGLWPWSHSYGSINGNLPRDEHAPNIQGLSAEHCRCCVFPLCYAVLAMFVIIVVAVSATVLCLVDTNAPQSKFSVEGDTVVLENTNTLFYHEWTVSECLHSGDYSHITSVYLVPSEDIIIHLQSIEVTSRDFDQPHPSRETGTLSEPIYLLDRSTIFYSICISSYSGSAHKGVLYIFDDHDNYNAFVDYVTDGSSAVYHRELPIGTDNDTICTEIIFNVTRPAYYYITAETPGGIQFHYSVTVHQVMLNHSDYEENCRISEPTSCQVTASTNFLQAEEYKILAYIHTIPPYDTDPPNTHICTTPHRSYTILVFPAILAAVFVVIFVVLTATHIIRCYCQLWKRSGYSPINTDLHSSF